MKQQPLLTPLAMIATASLAVAIVAGLAYWKQKKVRSRKHPVASNSGPAVPTRWRRVGEVKEMLLYPLKGGKRQLLDSGYFTSRGLTAIDESNKHVLQDREFLVFNDNIEFVNGKRCPNIMLVEISAVDAHTVKFTFPGSEDLLVKIPDGSNPDLHNVTFCRQEAVTTVDCGDEAAAWFSNRVINKPSGLRLGCYVSSVVSDRTLEGAYAEHAKVYTKLQKEYMGVYADVASYMLLGQESVQDLNSRLVKPVTHHNFRPNILVSGSPPYSEDTWDWLKIGDNVLLRSCMYCTRCVVTTTNPDTGKRDPNYEPLKTLRKYRQQKDPWLKKIDKDTPAFGVYFGCHRTGAVRVGDPVYVSDEAL